MTNCEIKVNYKDVPNKTIFKKKLSDLENYNSLRDLIIKKSIGRSNDIEKIKVEEKDKFVLEPDKGHEIPGINCIFDENTFGFLRSKLEENQTQSIKLLITKVDKYPEWKQPQLIKILDNVLNDAANETIEKLKEDLTQEYLENGYRSFMKGKKEEKSLTDEVFKDLHANVFCNKCQNGNFFGLRYICAECNNYNLCQNCYSKENYTHCKDHVFIRVKDPVCVDINNFSSIFIPNKKLEYRKYEPFDLDIEIMNNGTNDFKYCFVSPIRFGKHYLGCSKKTIDETIVNGEKSKLSLFITFEDETDDENFKPLEQYEGYFRLMTEEGIPFGDIFYLQVNIEN